MSSPRELRRRIRSVSSTAQITRAMQMVAASKMRKAQEAALSMRPFARALYAIQRKATSRAADFKHPLQEIRDVRKRAVVLVAADKGLCGALNTNVFRVASNFDPQSTVFITAGRKASQFVARTRRQLAAEFPYGDTPRYGESRAIAALARDLFLKGEVDQVQVVATRFINTLTQQAVTIDFLPIGADYVAQDRGRAGRGRAGRRHQGEPVRAQPAGRAGLPAPPLPQSAHVLRPAQCQGERAERADGRDEERHRQRGGADRRPESRIQQAATGQHHAGAAGDRRRPGWLRPRGIHHEHGQNRSSLRAGRGRGVPRLAAGDQQRVDGGVLGAEPARQVDAGSPATPGRQLGADDLDVGHRGAQARPAGGRQRRPDLDAGRPGRDGPDLRRDRQSRGRARSRHGRKALPHPPPAAVARRSVDLA